MHAWQYAIIVAALAVPPRSIAHSALASALCLIKSSVMWGAKIRLRSPRRRIAHTACLHCRYF